MGGIYQRLKGFADIYGESGARFAKMENTARDVFFRHAFRELRTPILESTDLFQRSIGAETDVVRKEMFTFPDRKGRSLTMRPEATAGVLRACIEEGLATPGAISRFFTIGPMFRYERPQKGRMRQFHQINCECLGSESPYADAEIILMLLDFLRALGLGGLKLKINSLGCRECRPAYLKTLGAYFQNLDATLLCPDCQTRVIANPLRVLDCKNEKCRELIREAPKLLDNNCQACREHIGMVMDLLRGRDVALEIDHHLVRGLDYYARTTFEVVSDRIGAQTAVAGGGRYDGLLGQLGGPDLPGIGFACGMERLALLLDREDLPALDFYLLTLDNEQRRRALDIAEDLRARGFAGEMNYTDGKMKSLMTQAARSGARFCLILGPDEALAGEIAMRDMTLGGQKKVAFADIANELGRALEKK